jgi:GTP-binding protein
VNTIDEQARLLFAAPCEFIWGTADIDNLPPADLPEAAFVGRSNAGKSSLINALTNRNHLARVSHTPGRTREINFFRLGEKLTLADLPGYGYAKVSKSQSAQWQQLIFRYLRGRPNLRRVLVLIDARRGIMESDKEIFTLLDEAAVSFAVVLTKSDQLSKTELDAAVSAADAEARRHKAAFPEITVTSAHKRTGLQPLKSQIALLAKH